MKANGIFVFVMMFIISAVSGQSVSVSPQLISNEVDDLDYLELELTGINATFGIGTGTSCGTGVTINMNGGQNGEEILFTDTAANVFSAGSYPDYDANNNSFIIPYGALYNQSITAGPHDVTVGRTNCYVSCTDCFEIIDFSIDKVRGNFCEGGTIHIDYINNAPGKFSAGNVFTAYLVRTFENPATANTITDTTVIGSISTTLGGSITGVLPSLQPILFNGSLYEFTNPNAFIYIVGSLPSFISANYELGVYDVVNNSSPELCMVTVDSNGYNQVFWNRNEDILNTGHVSIFKETTFSGIYDSLGTLPVNDPFFTDSNATPTITPSTYAVKTIDSCARSSQMSTPHKTMHLTVNAGQNGEWNLIWSQYLGTNVPSYRIWRGKGSVLNLLVIDSVSGSSYTYSDLNPPSGSGALFYQIEVLLDPCDTLILKAGDYASSRSNIANNGVVSSPDHESFFKPLTFSNPSDGILYFPGMEGHKEIYNIHGQRVAHSRSETLDFSKADNGVYFFKAAIGNGVYFQKVIKQ